MLALLQRSYAYMDGRIDPPSSLQGFDKAILREKSTGEELLLARLDDTLAGCCFLKDKGDTLYIGKLAVDPSRQGQGIGRSLIAAAIATANRKGCRALELQTRIELSENHKAFAAMGFRKTAESAHEGYERPTSITMRLDI